MRFYNGLLEGEASRERHFGQPPASAFVIGAVWALSSFVIISRITNLWTLPLTVIG